MIDWPLGPAFLVAGFVCAGVAPLVRRLALHLGAIDIPGGRKIHVEPVPRLGGVAVILGLAAAVGTSFLLDSGLRTAVLPLAVPLGLVALGTLFMLLVGVIDDIKPLSAPQKFAAEALAAFVIVQWAIPVHSIDLALITIPETLSPLPQILAALWIVAVVNAFNMIDGLDGLASGSGAIAAAAIALCSLHSGSILVGTVLAATGGALTGFLVHNGRPARIFLGDSGTLAVGFLLGTLSIMGIQRNASWYALPGILALAVPLLDLATAVIRRGLTPVQLVRTGRRNERYELRWHGSPGFFSPDARHIHHRLVSLGLTPRRAVLTLYGASSIVGMLAVTSVQWGQLAPYLVLLTTVVVAYFISRWFYEELWIFRRGVLLPFFETPLARSRLTHAVFDLVALTSSFIAAALLVGDPSPHVTGRALLASGCIISVFYATRVYAASMRYAGIWELLGVARALLYGVVLAAFLTPVAFHTTTLGLTQLLLFGYLALTTTAGARLSFRVLDAAYHRGREGNSRVLVGGAGRAGVAVLRELLGDPSPEFTPVGFIDDDSNLWGRRIEGFYVHTGGFLALEAVIAKTAATELVIATDFLPQHYREVEQIAKRAGVRILRARQLVDELHDQPIRIAEQLRQAVNADPAYERPTIRLS